MDQSVPLDVPLDFKRTKPGLSRKMRSLKYPEFFCYFDPDRLRACELPPSHVQSALEEVMGVERMKDLKLRPHPLLPGYWALCERVRHPKLGENLWHIVSIFHDGARDDYLPPELERMGLENLRGLIGLPRQPTKRDFEMVEATDKKRYGYKEVENRFAAQEDLEDREKDRIFNDRVEDFLDYNFWLAMRDAQDHYSRPWSTATIEPHTAPERWAEIPQNGYKIRVKRFSPAHYSLVDEEVRKELEKEQAEEEAFEREWRAKAEAERARLKEIRVRRTLGEGSFADFSNVLDIPLSLETPASARESEAPKRDPVKVAQ